MYDISFERMALVFCLCLFLILIRNRRNAQRAREQAVEIERMAGRSIFKSIFILNESSFYNTRSYEPYLLVASCDYAQERKCQRKCEKMDEHSWNEKLSRSIAKICATAQRCTTVQQSCRWAGLNPNHEEHKGVNSYYFSLKFMPDILKLIQVYLSNITLLIWYVCSKTWRW